MNKRQLLILCLLMLMSIGMAHGQTAYTYVRQNGTAVAADGLAGFSLSTDPSATPKVEFVDGKAVMTVAGKTLATLPMSSGGQLVVELDKPEAAELSELKVNQVSATVKAIGYGTFYSPFRLYVSESLDTRLYAPSYDSENNTFNCNSDTEIEGGYIPAGTGLLLKNEGNVLFEISADDLDISDGITSDLSGSALKIAKSEVALDGGEVIYTLGHEKSTNAFRFYEFAGGYLSPAKAYLVAPSLNSSGAKYISLNFDESATGIHTASALQDEGARKYLENGHVVIVRNGQKYNTNGQKIK